MLALLSLADNSARAAESLGDTLRKCGWEHIIGTWVDAETKGSKITTTYAWKYQDRVIQITTREGDKESVAIMNRNPNTGKVTTASADNQGGGSIGEWSLEDGDAVLGIAFVTGAGEEGVLRFRHHLDDKDTLLVTVELPEPITLKMVRENTQTAPDDK